VQHTNCENELYIHATVHRNRFL